MTLKLPAMADHGHQLHPSGGSESYRPWRSWAIRTRRSRQGAESMKLCAAEAGAQRADAESFFRRVAARQK